METEKQFKEIFGKMSHDQLSLFNEAELVDESSKPDEVKDVDIPEDTASGKKREKNRNLKTIKEKVIDIAMDNPVCDICGGKLVEIKPKITKRLVYGSISIVC